MKKYEVYSGDELISGNTHEADTFFSRFRGLMMRRTLGESEGLLLKNCPAIHCFFMRFTIDAVYLDGNMGVIGVETVRPWRLGKIHKGAKHTLEVGEGKASSVKAGMKLRFKEVVTL